jgi:hypothetical protein
MKANAFELPAEVAYMSETLIDLVVLGIDSILNNACDNISRTGALHASCEAADTSLIIPLPETSATIDLLSPSLHFPHL